MGENLKVVKAEHSTLRLAVFVVAKLLSTLRAETWPWFSPVITSPGNPY
jgi:hypothetical protein